MSDIFIIVILINFFMHLFYFYGINTIVTNYFPKTYLKYEFRSSFLITSILFIVFYYIFYTYMLDGTLLGDFINYFFLLSLFYVYASIIKPYLIILLNKKDRSKKYEDFLKKHNYYYPVFITDPPGKNAYALGFLPKGKVIMITKEMINSMSDRDIEAILLHEVGHHQKKHLPYFFSIVLFVNIIMILILVFVNQHIKKEIGIIDMVFMIWGVPYALIMYYLEYIRKPKELEADAFSAKILGAEVMINALNNFNMATEGRLEKHSNSHPVLSKRIKSLEKLL